MAPTRAGSELERKFASYVMPPLFCEGHERLPRALFSLQPYGKVVAERSFTHVGEVEWTQTFSCAALR